MKTITRVDYLERRLKRSGQVKSLYVFVVKLARKKPDNNSLASSERVVIADET